MRRWRPAQCETPRREPGSDRTRSNCSRRRRRCRMCSVRAMPSMVHGELGYGPLEIATLHGICSSGMMALKNAYLQVAIGEKLTAISVASEFASRFFKSSRFDEMGTVAEEGSLPLEAAFLRYMLSDGAGAAVIQSAPRTFGISLRIDWISLTSYANTEKACMFFGSN